MLSRREIEVMILVGLGQIRTMEENMSRHFGALPTAEEEVRVAFHASLQELESRTNQLEWLVEALDRLNTRPATTAA